MKTKMYIIEVKRPDGWDALNYIEYPEGDAELKNIMRTYKDAGFKVRKKYTRTQDIVKLTIHTK